MSDRTNRLYNLQLLKDLTIDENGFPVIHPISEVPSELIGFNYCMNTRPDDRYVHFFTDDYQFERVWNNPERYVEPLKKWGGVLSPDFSLYTDMPIPLQAFNVYRSRLIASYLQANGINVIPTLQWSDFRSFEFSFDGLPQKSILAVSSVGCVRRKESRALFNAGISEAIKRLDPSKILFYGHWIEFEHDGIEIIKFDSKETNW